ncbi:MAG: heavy metal-binding domain-containing protein [Acidimicrobiales bacterium]
MTSDAPAGGGLVLPEAARKRIAAAGAGSGGWSSDLSVGELAAIRQSGFQPVGLVMGSSIYRLGGQYGNNWYSNYGGRGGYFRQYPCPHGFGQWGAQGHFWGANWEHSYHEAGLEEAQRLAMSRLEEEATELGAHGVVGVRLTFRHLAAVGGLVEFTVVGTGIHRPGVAPLATPFTSHLSGQDFAKLMRSGCIPAALVMGIAALEADPGCGARLSMNSWVNGEVQQYSDVIDAARAIATQKLERATSSVGDAVVGANIDLRVHDVGESKLAEVMVIGTAVRRFATAPLDEPPLPMMRLVDR